jgi:uncharacterized membrane protein
MTLIIALVLGIWLLYGLVQMVIGICQIIWAVILCAAALCVYTFEGTVWLGRVLLVSR